MGHLDSIMESDRTVCPQDSAQGSTPAPTQLSALHSLPVTDRGLTSAFFLPYPKKASCWVRPGSCGSQVCHSEILYCLRSPALWVSSAALDRLSICYCGLLWILLFPPLGSKVRMNWCLAQPAVPIYAPCAPSWNSLQIAVPHWHNYPLKGAVAMI